MRPGDFPAARAVIQSGLAARAFPAASIEVGRADGALWTEAFGHLTYDEGAAPCRTDTLFDLASLTKVVVTASLAMHHVAAGRLALDTRIAERLPSWRGIDIDRETTTIRHLLDHSSGLPAHARLFERCSGRGQFDQAIARMPLDAPPGAAAVYSDLGFIVLGFLLEDAGASPLDAQFDARRQAWAAFIGGGSSQPLLYRPISSLAGVVAPTELDPWRGRLLQGDVHDENAAALGGVAGHAGLFGSVEAVGAFARLVLRTFAVETPLGTPALMRRFAERSRVAGSSRALAWDTMKPTSSCGRLMSAEAIGHTGYTGTSLWIDEVNDLYMAFLTNRVHPTRQNDALVKLRPVLHDAILSDATR